MFSLLLLQLCLENVQINYGQKMCYYALPMYVILGVIHLFHFRAVVSLQSPNQIHWIWPNLHSKGSVRHSSIPAGLLQTERACRGYWNRGG